MSHSERRNIYMTRLESFSALLYSELDSRSPSIEVPIFHMFDFFIIKLINKLVIGGNKAAAMRIFRGAMYALKRALGFQPFFHFKESVFCMRQIYKVHKKLLRGTKIVYKPLMLMPHNQVAYSINHIVAMSKQLCIEERKRMSDSLCITMLNMHLQYNHYAARASAVV